MIFIFLVLLTVTVFVWFNVFMFLTLVERYIQPTAVGGKNTHQIKDFKSIENKVNSLNNSLLALEDSVYISLIDMQDCLNAMMEHLSSSVNEVAVNEESFNDVSFREMMEERVKVLASEIEDIEEGSIDISSDVPDFKIKEVDDMFFGYDVDSSVEVITDEDEVSVEDRC